MEKREYTITIFTGNKVGILSRVVSVFTRRHINIESIVASESAIKDIFKYTIVVIVTEDLVRKLVAQLDKQIDVLKSFHYEEDQIVQQEIALYKVSTSGLGNPDTLERIIRGYNARVLRLEPEFMVLEKTGLRDETEGLLDELREHTQVFEFVRSGRIAIIKPMESLNTYLKSLGGSHSGASGQ